MSLSPVTGTEVPETANGDVTPVSSGNGPQIPASVKRGGSRVPRPEDQFEDTYVDAESSVYDGDDHLEVYNHQRTSGSASLTSRVIDDSETRSRDVPDDSDAAECPGAALRDPAHSHQRGGQASSNRQQMGAEKLQESTEGPEEEDDGGEKEKQDEEEDEKNDNKWIQPYAGGRTEAGPLQHYSSSAPGPSTTSSTSPSTPPLPTDDCQCPPHVMAQVWVRNGRGMQDSKSLDEISQACGGGAGSRGGGRGGQSEGRRATISSALELEGTVSHEGDLTNFITKNLEQKIKMSSKPSLDCSDSDSGSGPIYRSRGPTRRPADIPPIDPTVLLDLQKHTQEVAHRVEMMMRSLNGTIQNMTALSVGYIQTYRDSVDSLGESVDMSIKGMYTLMARCEELDRSMQPIHTLAAQIRDVKRTLDALEALCK
ncbi:BLOC-1 related complex subunit 6 [Takifugu flavidus]|uniref:BLOC-1-related complex subunit 6 n=2 Tax=Takifugu TaxID=31032 RepID=A0A5C6MQG5_9TELE|nr:BLOC-1 related complex subunit 6 [Takifugu flavidus]XP_056897063.1 BLOC-1 related complex subunit 6 [Takifugu flavidus]XP_056897064.1 BLOC-1 related complex subunit 6 [Takifugu flavidus]TWW56401.1 BLOC-1-related complex subunit 6 [Takifugu flavidus]